MSNLGSLVPASPQFPTVDYEWAASVAKSRRKRKGNRLAGTSNVTDDDLDDDEDC